MKLKYLLSGVAVAAMVALPVAQPTGLPLGAGAVQAQEANVSINVFFDALAEQGTWVKHPEFRYVWVPNDVAPDWAPYTHGRWANTERYGWTFVSDEPFAWAVYHYGRWGYDPAIGWYWVPGTVWAPAWVSWRRGSDAVGWAPLPPAGEGYAASVEVSSAEPPRGYWHFVPAREFLAPDLAVVIIHDEEPFDETEVVGPVVVENNIVINNVIDVDFVQQATGRQVEVTKVQVVNDPAQAERPAEQGAIVAVEGQLAEPAEDAAPPKAVEPKEVKAPTVGQDIEATTGSIEPNEQQQPGEATPGAGQATGGEQAGGKATTGEGAAGQPKTVTPGAPESEQDKAATGTSGEEGTQPGTQQIKPREKAAKGQTEQQTGEAPAKPKVEGQDKTGKAATGTDEPGSTASGATEEQGKPKADEPKAAKRKVDEGAAEGETQSGKAPAAGSDERDKAQGAGETDSPKSAQKKLKKQPGAETQDQTGAGETRKSAQKPRKGADEGQAAAQPDPDAQGAAAKGPRRLKQADQQEPSQEKTGAIPEAKPKGDQGGEQASPEAAAPKAKSKAQGCSAEQQSAGSC